MLNYPENKLVSAGNIGCIRCLCVEKVYLYLEWVTGCCDVFMCGESGNRIPRVYGGERFYKCVTAVIEKHMGPIGMAIKQSKFVDNGPN